jgi:hypothetical protein
MYTYDSFETSGVFTLLRPFSIAFLIALLIMFIFVISPILRTKMVNGLSVVGLSIISIVVSAQLMFYHGIIVDELTSYMTLITVLLSIINPIIFFNSHKKKVNSVQQ